MGKNVRASDSRMLKMIKRLLKKNKYSGASIIKEIKDNRRVKNRKGKCNEVVFDFAIVFCTMFLINFP